MRSRIQFDSLETRQHFAFGVPVASFGVNGQTTAPLASAGTSIETTVLANGSIITGTTTAILKFSASGTRDNSFGSGGKIAIGSFVYADHAVDGSGRIYLLTRSGSGTVVLRYTATGQLDSTYGTGGTALVESGKAFRARAIDVGSDGKVVVAGYVYAADDSDVTRVYRLSADGGSLDSGFSGDGKVDFALGASNLLTPKTEDTVVDVRVLSNNKVSVLGGSFAYQPDFTDEVTGQYFPAVYGASQLAIARLTSGGVLDTGFNGTGIGRKGVFDGRALQPVAGALRADGSGVVTVTDESAFDASDRTAFVGFSASGKTAFTTIAPDFYAVNTAVDATPLADGRVAFASYSSPGRVWMINTDGALGNVVTPAGWPVYSNSTIAATPDGDLITAVSEGSTSIWLAKLDAGAASDGRPDDLDAAIATDAAKDTNGNLHIAYMDAATKTLKYVYRNAQGFWSTPKVIDNRAGAGANLSIDARIVDKQVRVAIAYYAASTADMQLATGVGQRKWAIQTLATKGAVGLSPNVLFTDAGYWAVTYHSKTTGSLYYAVHNGKQWTYELVDTNGSGAWNELQFDPSTRRPAVAYSGPGNTVKYALKSDKGWGNTVAITTSAGAGFVNLALPDNVTYYGPLISYYDLATADLVLLRYDRNAAAGNRWSATTIASRGIVGSYSDLATDYTGGAKLVAWNRSNNSVSQYTIGRYEPSAVANVVVTGGGKNLSAAALNYYGGEYTDLVYTDTLSGKTFVR